MYGYDPDILATMHRQALVSTGRLITDDEAERALTAVQSVSILPWETPQWTPVQEAARLVLGLRELTR